MRMNAWRRAAAIGGVGIALAALTPRDALAHCDTMDGPVVTAARGALESGSVERVLIWVRPQDDGEIRRAFEHTLAVRKLGGEARQLADHFFFETLVRVHRAGEGEPYTGLKPAGIDHGPVIPAADRALAAGSVDQLESVLMHAVRDGLRARFDRAMAAKTYAPGDVQAGREFVAAYVPLLHYAEQLYALAANEGHDDARGADPHRAGAHDSGSHKASTGAASPPVGATNAAPRQTHPPKP